MTTENLIYLLMGVLDGAALMYCVDGILELRRARRTAAEIREMVKS